MPRARSPHEIDVFELKQRMDDGTAPLVLDVREAPELNICAIAGTKHIPMSEFERRFEAELGGKRDEEIVIQCRSGQRSAQVQGFLVHFGFTKTRNLAGGILAWATAIDQTMKKY